jgi:hypothetical protein
MSKHISKRSKQYTEAVSAVLHPPKNYKHRMGTKVKQQQQKAALSLRKSL